MDNTLQINRQYSLIIGDATSRNALEIHDLQVTFEISKSSNNKNKTNSASIEIYNLSDDQLKILDVDYPAAVFNAGYKNTGGPKQLFAGQITSTSTRKSGVDRVTQITMGTGYVELNHQILSETVPPGSDVKKVADRLIKAIGADRGIFNGTNLNSPIVYGYPLSGTPKEMLDELCDKYNCHWQLEDGVVYVHDNDRGNSEDFNQAYVISKYTGMFDIPYRVSGDVRRSKKDKAKKPAIQVKIQLNPDIRAGDIIKIEDTLTNGWFVVTDVRHSGGWRSSNWDTEIKANVIEKVVREK